MRLTDVSVVLDGENLIPGLDSSLGMQDVLDSEQRGRAPEFTRNTDKNRLNSTYFRPLA